jgi:hypothetical protein
MATTPFLIYLEAAAAGNGQVTLSYTVNMGEKITILDVLQDGTGEFLIQEIRTGGALRYTDRGTSQGIPRSVFKELAQPNLGFDFMEYPLVVVGNQEIFFDCLDTSGSSNTIRIVLKCHRETMS